ncbi:MAG: glycosyl hydrolase family 28-related protein, partial [Verrucomicrobiota bacterium]
MFAFSAFADQTKANNNTALQLGGSWVSGTAPGGGDNAIWNSTVSTAADCTNTLDSAVTWNGIVVANPAAPVSIDGSTTLTLNNGINLAGATRNLILNCGTIAVVSSQTWTVASGMTVTTGSASSAGSVNAANNFVRLVGGGTWIMSGTGDNGSLGVTLSAGMLELNKASSSGAHAIGGPGLSVNSGATVQLTGTGGDQIYDGASVTDNGTLDLYGNSETINGLNGSGTVTTTLSNGTPTLTLGGMGAGGTFTGTIEAGNSGSITLTTSNVQSVSSVSRGSATAGPFINVNAGTLTLNGTSDNAYASATVASGATLLLAKASSSSAHAIGGGGLTINSGGLVRITGTGGDQISDSSGVASSGTFDLNGNSETVASLSFSGGTLQNSSSTTASLTDRGSLTMNGNVTVNEPKATVGTTVILQYAGTRSGSGSFVAGSLPAGATVIDNTTAQTVSVVNESSSTFPQVLVPTLNTNEMIVAATTPQEYGAKGDGITDDSAAFQAAMNAVYNSGGNGGGVVYMPPANYAFANPVTIPTGVTLQGDWQDWTLGTSGLVGTTIKVYCGAGSTNNEPFITMGQNAALKDVNIWYPDQNPSSITPYPFTIALVGNNCVVQNVALVNSYLGIQANGGAEWILSTVIGTPLSLGLWADGLYDICQTEDIRFSPAAWANSGLTNAPTAGGAYAAWMMANGTGMQIFRADGVINVHTTISGYNLGLDFEQSANGNSGCAFYDGCVTNCNIAVQATTEQNAGGLEFSDCTLIGGMAINANVSTNNSTIHCSHCTIIGTNGTAVYGTGANWSSVMAFQDCVISNLLDLAGPGVFNLVDCSLNGSTQCVMSASATRAAFTGCTFSPAQKIINNGRAGNLIVNSRSPLTNAMPAVNWTNVINNYVSRQPASATLYVATGYGATGNGATDDTAAINRALASAGNNGGGIVYLPPGNYHTTNTLNVPSGVELRGAYELRHGTWGGNDGIEKGSIIDPYGGQGTTSGPPAVALAANSGLVGMTFNYPNQTYDIPFPPTIQGQGANVYIIGVQCAEPWIYVDLDTYTCTNHFLYMVDGWALNTWVRAGNGSAGTIADTHGNPTYWVDNPGGQNQMNWDIATGLVFTNAQTYVLGNCTELFVKVFSYGEKTFMHCSSEGGVGPSVTAISAMCDGTYQSYLFDATGPCTLTNVNSEWWCAFNQFTNWTASAALISTTNFTGTARFLNVPLWGGSPFDYEVNGGDIGLELVQLPQAAGGVQVNGGVFHLVNAGILNGASSPFLVTYGMGAGLPGMTNEFIGCYAYNGCNYGIGNVTNLYAIWNNYALSSYQLSSLGPVVLGDFTPNGAYQFQPAGALAFLAYSANGINSSGITVLLTGTNLLGQGYVTNYTITNGLGVLGSSTTKGVSFPLVTNAVYTAVMRVTDVSGNSATNTESFDTISPAFTFEAEDFDYDGGNYVNSPQTNAYAGLIGVAGIDYSNGIPGEGSASYRPQGLETEPAGDKPRLAYAAGLQDFDVGFANTGNWGNYTRSFPAGTYNIYMRSASALNPEVDSASLYLVTAGQGTLDQTTSLLGTFASPNTGGWQTYAWVPLLNGSGGLVDFTGGSVQTLRVKTVHGDNNINFYLLVATNTQVPSRFNAVTENQPVVLQVLAQPTSAGQNLTLQWPVSATTLSLYYAASLTPPVVWIQVTNAVA